MGILCSSLHAQNNKQQSFIDRQLWMDYNYQAPFSDKFSLVGDVGIRGLISNYDWNQVYVRPGVKYQFNPYFGIAGSLAGFFTFNRDVRDLYEFRVTVDALAKWPDLKILNLSYRFRIENRTLILQNDPDVNNNWRARLLISLNSKKFHVFSQQRAIYFQAQYEPFLNLGHLKGSEVFIKQTRIYAIFGHRISNAFGYDLQYIWQHNRLSAAYDLSINVNMIRIRFYHRIQKRSKP
jgi:hypothetical protein